MAYGVVIERWPIERFIAPSELTWPEVDILLGAWTSGTTYFRKMDQEEWDEWHENHMLPQASSSSLTLGASSSSPPAESSSSSSSWNAPQSLEDTNTSQEQISSLAAEPQPANSLQGQTPIVDITNNAITMPMPGAIQFINSLVPGMAAAGVRQRKRRLDAGKKRGPRKKAASTTMEATS
ncbi:hypothetical protein C0992_004921 [Termitomyces sp. T32_za158]|nr:hypothetical protein C0992_004921 [Termitomyces sp. T32_za158]